MTASLRSFTDAAADAVARAIAGLQREAQRERELRDAEHRARMAELDARMMAVTDLERQVAARLATVKDGEPGRDGADGVNGTDGLPGEAGKDGANGRDIDPEIVKASIAECVDATLAGWERPQDGRSVTVEELSPLVEESVQRAVAAIPAPRDGVDGKDGVDGQHGERGTAGKLPIVRVWSDKVHYESDTVSHEGATFQALRDTAKEPPHEDWICIARAGSDGRDGRSFTIRGTWADGEDYRALDVVALGGASFAARHDSPGACPGEGWQLIAAQGKRGNPGERGPSLKGERGVPGPAVASIDINDDALLVLTNADGSQVDVDLYPLLSKL